MRAAAAVLIVGALIAAGMVHYYSNKIAVKRSELSLVETKLWHKPEVTHYHGKDYIRIVPGTVGNFTNDSSNDMGTFAEVKYVK